MKYPEDFIDKIICGDCIEVMKQIPDNSIDLIFFSPPYNLGKMKKGSYYGGKNRKLTYDTYNDDIPYSEYIDWQNRILKECMRLINDSGAIFYNHKPRIVNKVFDDRKKLLPFPLRQEIIWYRGGMINFNGNFLLQILKEFSLCVKKNGNQTRNIWG